MNGNAVHERATTRGLAGAQRLRRLRAATEELLSQAGIRVNGDNPWDIRVHNPEFFRRAITEDSLGPGESYMDGWWDCDRLDEFICRIVRNDIHNKLRRNLPLVIEALASRVFNRQSSSRAYQVGRRHYDLGNDLFQCMLDRRLVYSCAYWKGASTLEEAQENKLDLICRKVGIGPGMRVLDIGCGWGSFAKFASERYGAEVVGVTVSREQVELGTELCRGLPVELRLQDYREVRGRFDRVVSVGMFEHVGHKNYRTFMEVAHRCLKDGGLMLLHTIGSNVSRDCVDAWTNRYIFPNGLLPSVKQIGASIEGLFVMEDWHNFSADYDRTLMAWHANFERNWGVLKEKYGERFRRMWRYYLLSCAGAFRARYNQLWQIVLSKGGVPGGYVSLR